MKIGELSRATGTPVETIRFYEREGLLLHSARTAGNYRVYDDSHAKRLAFIRHCRSLDMTLDEVRVLLRFKDAPGDNCGEVNSLLDEHIGHVASRIDELQQLQVQLKALREQCAQAQPASDCGILQELSQAAQVAAPSSASTHAHTGHVGGAHAHGPSRSRPTREHR